MPQSTIDSEGFKGGTRGAPIMPRDAVSRTANVERIYVECIYEIYDEEGERFRQDIKEMECIWIPN